MKTSSLQSTIIKEVAIVLVCLLLGLASTAFAAGGEEGKKDAKKALSAAEIELFQKLDEAYQRDLMEALENFEHPPSTFDRVEIYDASGTLLKAIDLNGKPFSETMLLPHAERVVVTGKVAVYMVI